MGVKLFTDNGTQADRIIKRFGGARDLAHAIREATGKKCDPSRVFRWRMPRENGGTGGLIPAHAVPGVKAAARLVGVVLHPEDWAPVSLLPDVDLAAVEDATTDVAEAA